MPNSKQSVNPFDDSYSHYLTAASPCQTGLPLTGASGQEAYISAPYRCFYQGSFVKRAYKPESFVDLLPLVHSYLLLN